jgi:hypothetical protein
MMCIFEWVAAGALEQEGEGELGMRWRGLYDVRRARRLVDMPASA